MAWSLASLRWEKVCFSSHVMPTWVCAMAGIYGCGLLYLSLFQHYIRQQTTANDYSLIPMIIAGADEIVQGKYPDTVVYRRSLEKEYYYVECTRMGRKRLAMKTFYKTKIGG